MPTLGAKFETKPGNLLALLGTAKERVYEQLGRDLQAVGAESVSMIQRTFRTGGTTQTRTAVRSGRLLNSYGFNVERDRGRSYGSGERDFRLDIGAIRPTDGGRVPLHARVHEGYDATGNRVSQFVIRPKVPHLSGGGDIRTLAGGNGGYLVFPIRRGGGLAASGIVGWAKVRQVILKPRPSLDAAKEQAVKQVDQRARLLFRRVLVGEVAS